MVAPTSPSPSSRPAALTPPPVSVGPDRAPRRVVVAGVGLVTPLGVGAWATYAALLAGRRITDRIVNLEPDTAAVPLVQAVGGVSVARHTAVDPAVELAERAAREAAGEAGVGLAGLATWLGTSKGAVGRFGEAAARRQLPGGPPMTFDHALAGALGPHGYLAHHLQLRTGLRPRGHCVAACASSLTALHQARMALRGEGWERWGWDRVAALNPGKASDGGGRDCALVLTAEAALLPVFIHSYQRLGVLAPLTLEGYRGRPLSAARRGFVLAEVGAAVLLRRLGPGESPTAGQIELVDSAIATEAEDLVRPSAEMAGLKAVVGRLTGGRRWAAVHPHAPGTAEHDPRELSLLAEAVAESRSGGGGGGGAVNDQKVEPPAVYAHKGALGHTLGSAGLVSLVLACLAARCGKLPPMGWLEDEGAAIRDAGLPIGPRPTLPADGPGGGHLVLAAGFAGHVAGAVIARA